MDVARKRVVYCPLPNRGAVTMRTYTRDPKARINSAKATVEYELEHAVKDGDCLLSHRKQPSNTYPRVAFRWEGKRRPMPVHRLVMLVKIGPKPEGAETRHLCGNHWCINPAHLCYGSTRENAQDSLRHGTAHWQHLSAGQVRDIRARYRKGVNQWDVGNRHEIAAEYGIHPDHVPMLVRGVTWKRTEA